MEQGKPLPKRFVQLAAAVARFIDDADSRAEGDGEVEDGD